MAFGKPPGAGKQWPLDDQGNAGLAWTGRIIFRAPGKNSAIASASRHLRQVSWHRGNRVGLICVVGFRAQLSRRDALEHRTVAIASASPQVGEVAELCLAPAVKTRVIWRNELSWGSYGPQAHSLR